MQFDWFTLLLIFFFIILPLLQQLTGKRRPPETEEAEEEGWQDQAPQGRTRERPPVHEEWDPWDERDQLEAAREQEARNAWEELGLEDLFRDARPEPRVEPVPPRPEHRAEPAPPPAPAPLPRPLPRPETWDEWRVEPPPPPPPVRVPKPPVVEAPVRAVSLERLEVDREAEHARFRRSYLQPAPDGVPVPRASRAGEMLRHPGSIREAIVLAEILGPPRALRGQEER